MRGVTGTDLRHYRELFRPLLVNESRGCVRSYFLHCVRISLRIHSDVGAIPDCHWITPHLIPLQDPETRPELWRMR